MWLYISSLKDLIKTKYVSHQRARRTDAEMMSEWNAENLFNGGLNFDEQT